MVTPNISETVFDLIIIGAGINGAGTARDAAMRGLSVLLLDKGDIGGGTSSWSTRLIHGGLRYLEHGEVGLVRESLREREILFRIASHLVKPLPLLIPFYEASRRGPRTIRAGLLAYDALARGNSLPVHEVLTRAEALERAPGLNTDGLLGAALYYDAQVEFAERLVLENALAAKKHGATVKTYARVKKFIIEKQSVQSLEIEDLISHDSCLVHGRMTINAAGPWVDQVAGTLGIERLIGGTKGSHIVVAPFPAASSTALYIEARADRRPFFVIPWNGQVLIGTTDTHYEGDLDAVEISDDEIEYLLAETNHAIPQAHLTRESILFAYSGVRPLAYTRNNNEGKITRRHFIYDHAPQLKNFLSLVGGKLTTYRSLSQQAVDLVFRKLQLKVPRCTTDQEPLPGATPSALVAYSYQFAAPEYLPTKTVDHLLRVYGTRAPQVLILADSDPALLEIVSAETGAIAAEIVFAFRHELAMTLSDCLLRRTMIGLSASAGIGEDETAARIAEQHLGWSEDRARDEVAAYRTRYALRL
ncbi:MAG: glycerol-3-phosphate dehydrogenase [Acidobacteriota bacterium]|nr:glycerol-3-phosphate dehydrogenase [Acidobacteriota bacterium]